MLPTQLPACFLADIFTDQFTVNASCTVCNTTKKDSIALHSHFYIYIHLAIFTTTQSTRTVKEVMILVGDTNMKFIL